MAKTVTVNMDEGVLLQFRRFVAARYGTGKGLLGRAFTDAVREFVKRGKEEPDAFLLNLAKKGFDMGKLKSPNRAEWHER